MKILVSFSGGKDSQACLDVYKRQGEFSDPVTLKAADNTEFTARPTYSYKVMKNRAIDIVFDNKHIDKAEMCIRDRRKVDYDWNKLGSDYKFLKKSEKYKFNGNSDFDIISGLSLIHSCRHGQS